MKQYRLWLHYLLVGGLWVLLLTSRVDAACTVSTTSINFSNYDFLSPAPDTGTGSVTLSCTPRATVKIAIGASVNSGAFYPRRMKHTVSAETLDYNIYTSAAMIQVWGDGTNGTATADFFDVRRNNIPPITIYGKIDPLQNVPAGSYREQLVVTITY
jgi:spore coat protein U-like protein